MASKLKNPFVVQSISKMYLNADFADFIFTLQGELVPVHKNILATASPVFAAMFFGLVKDKETVEITDSYAGAFKEFTQFFYLNEVALTMENIEEVAKLADKYDMLDCLNTCAAFLEDQLTGDNMVWGLKLAISLNNQKLKQFCEKYISSNTEEVFESDAFLRCDRSVLKNILEMDVLKCTETQVFDACLSWAKYACEQDKKKCTAEEMRAKLGDCLYLIRFAAMKMDAFGEFTEPYRGLLTGDEVAEIIYAITVPSSKAGQFIRKPRVFSMYDLRKLDISKALLCKPNFSSLGLCGLEIEPFSFSVSSRALLGEINCSALHSESVSGCSWNVRIVEFASHSTDADQESKTLFEVTMKLGHQSYTKLPLTHAFILQPQKKYEIYFVSGANYIFNDCFIQQTSWNSNYKLDDELTVTLHSKKNSMLSSLSFFRI